MKTLVMLYIIQRHIYKFKKNRFTSHKNILLNYCIYFFLHSTAPTSLIICLQLMMKQSWSTSRKPEMSYIAVCMLSLSLSLMYKNVNITKVTCLWEASKQIWAQLYLLVSVEQMPQCKYSILSQLYDHWQVLFQVMELALHPLSSQSHQQVIHSNHRQNQHWSCNLKLWRINDHL